MTRTPKDAVADGSIAPLSADDLGDVVAIDSALSGTSRRGFFEKRLAAALEEPGDFIYVGLRQEKRLVGYALARLVEGEFGKPGARAALDAIGVDPALRGKAAGRRLLAAVEELLRHKGVSELTTEVKWESRDLLGFFASAGFAMAPRVVLTRPTAQPIS